MPERVRSLIEKLKSGSSASRTYAAGVLGARGEDAGIYALIDMAEGKERDKSRHWYTLWSFRTATNYNISDQLTALRALKENENPLAVEYLEERERRSYEYDQTTRDAGSIMRTGRPG